MIAYDVNMNAGGMELHLNALTVNLRITPMHLMVGLRGKETNICLWEMVRYTWEKHGITIGVHELVPCSTQWVC